MIFITRISNISILKEKNTQIDQKKALFQLYSHARLILDFFGKVDGYNYEDRWPNDVVIGI